MDLASFQKQEKKVRGSPRRSGPSSQRQSGRVLELEELGAQGDGGW